MPIWTTLRLIKEKNLCVKPVTIASALSAVTHLQLPFKTGTEKNEQNSNELLS